MYWFLVLELDVLGHFGAASEQEAPGAFPDEGGRGLRRIVGRSEYGATSSTLHLRVLELLGEWGEEQGVGRGVPSCAWSNHWAWLWYLIRVRTAWVRWCS